MTVCEPIDRPIEQAWRRLEGGQADLSGLKRIAGQIRADPSLPEGERARQLDQLGAVIWEYSIREFDGY